jgi:pilus assembly protein CpaC
VSVPGLTTRHSETTIRLRSGQSFAIAGLLNNRIENVNSKVPLLGDIPIIGMLFRRTEARRKETEMVILATADLVQPLKPGQVPSLPGEDEFSDPDSWSLFLMGWIDAEVKKPGAKARKAAGPVGFSR